MNSIFSRLLQKLRGPEARKNLLYYISQIFMLASPIIVLPYLGRVVGPAGIGLYGSGQALALLVTTVVDFNLVQSGARRAARIRHDPVQLNQLVGEVLGAKILLTLVMTAVCACLFFAIGMLRANILVFATALVFGIVQGHTVYWFFGGTGKLQFVAITDVIGRMLGVIAIFLLVHSTSQLWLVFVAQAAGGGAGILAAFAFMTVKFTGLVKPEFRGGLRLMRANFHLFAQSLIGTLYTGSTALLMGLVATPAVVGYFSAAERMMRIGTLAFMPVRQTFFPGVSALVHEDPPRSARVVRQLVLGAGGINIFVSFCLLFLGDKIIRIMFGHDFGHSIQVLQILAILPFLLILQDILGNLWLIPLHHDRYCTFVVMVSGAIHVTGVVLLTMLWGATGGAIAMLISNLTATLLIVAKTLSLSINPLSGTGRFAK